MKKLSVVCLSLLALFADGCQKHSLVLVPALAKPALYAKKGDVLEWYKPDGKTDMPVTFSASGGSPCREGSATVTVCHVTVSTGIFSYSCDGCRDPVVVVGKSGSTAVLFQGMRSAEVPTGFNDPVGVACDSAGNAFVDPQTASVGDQFQWFATGAHPVPAWSFELADVCFEGSSFDQNRTTCTVKQDAAGKTYRVSIPSCQNTKTYDAQITVKQRAAYK